MAVPMRYLIRCLSIALICVNDLALPLTIFMCRSHNLRFLVADWLPSGKKLLSWLTVCFPCNLSLCNINRLFYSVL